MSASDFDGLYDGLGLDQLPTVSTFDATFVPRANDTLHSAPRDESASPQALSGTLPRLQLTTPEAAQLDPATPELDPLQVLGEGGMGRVLLARQSSLGRDVAVKVLRQGTAASAEALIHEARTTGSLEHPAVVPIYALARDSNGQPALVMKRVEGVSWRELLHASEHPAWAKLSAEKRDRLAFHVEVLAQVCNAIAHAHQRGVLHRDVKPANVLLGDLGEVYLADWGVALKRSDTQTEPTRLVGTPAYLAPEMVTGDAKRMDERTDVYLLGATLHEVLTGVPPHMGSSLREVMQHAWESSPPELPADAPPLLAAACRRALSADPGARFPSATALRDELKRFLQHRGASELALAASRRLAELEAMTSLSADAAEQRRWYTLVSECRFGFKQALESSPGHDVAREGLRRCLEVAARHELERGAAAAARAVLAELDAPPKELIARVEQLEQRDREAAAAQTEMKRLSHEQDLGVSRYQRTALMVVMAAAIAVMVTMLVVSGQREVAEAEYGTWIRLLPLSVVACVYFVAAIIGRRSLFSNRINRQMMALLGVAIVGDFVHRAMSVVLGLSLNATLSEDAIMFASLAAFAATVMHRGFWVPCGLLTLGAIGSVVWPERALSMFGVAVVSAIVSTSVLLRWWRKRDEGKRVSA